MIVNLLLPLVNTFLKKFFWMLKIMIGCPISFIYAALRSILLWTHAMPACFCALFRITFSVISAYLIFSYPTYLHACLLQEQFTFWWYVELHYDVADLSLVSFCGSYKSVLNWCDISGPFWSSFRLWFPAKVLNCFLSHKQRCIPRFPAFPYHVLMHRSLCLIRYSINIYFSSSCFRNDCLR